MRAERTTLPFNADAFQAVCDDRLDANHLLSPGLHPYPKRTGSAAWRKRADTAQLESKWRMLNRVAHGLDDSCGPLVGDFSDEHQRNVQLIVFRPADRRGTQGFLEARLLVDDPTLRDRSDFDRSKEPSHPTAASAATCSWRPAPTEISPCRVRRETGTFESVSLTAS